MRISNLRVLSRAAIAIALLALSSGALAVDTEDQKHTFNIAAVVAYYKYKEPSIPMHFKGPMFGISAEYVNRGLFCVFGRPSYLAVQSTYMEGRNDYNGIILNTGQKLTVDNVRDSYVESRGLVGLTFKPMSSLSVVPYVGFGHRFLVNRFNKKSSAGYRRTSTYWYIPIGLSVTKRLECGWSVTLTGEFDYFLKGRQTSRASDALPQPNYGNVAAGQNGGHGIKASIKVEKRFTTMGVFVEPYFSYWNVSKSRTTHASPTDEMYEPRNRTREIGLKLGVSF